MNYLSHYYCAKGNTPEYYLGLFLPDLVDRFSFLHNKYFAHFDVIELSEKELDTWNGIQQHYFDDAYFHEMPAFKEGMRTIESLMNQSSVLQPIKRKFLISHVLYELILDHLVILKNPNIVREVYYAIEKINSRNIYEFLKKITGDIPEIEVFLEVFERFMARRFLNFYAEEENLVKALHRVSAQIGNWEYNEQTKNAFLPIIADIKSKIDFDTLFEDIKSHAIPSKK